MRSEPSGAIATPRGVRADRVAEPAAPLETVIGVHVACSRVRQRRASCSVVMRRSPAFVPTAIVLPGDPPGRVMASTLAFPEHVTKTFAPESTWNRLRRRVATQRDRAARGVRGHGDRCQPEPLPLQPRTPWRRLATRRCCRRGADCDWAAERKGPGSETGTTSPYFRSRRRTLSRCSARSRPPFGVVQPLERDGVPAAPVVRLSRGDRFALVVDDVGLCPVGAERDSTAAQSRAWSYVDPSLNRHGATSRHRGRVQDEGGERVAVRDREVGGLPVSTGVVDVLVASCELNEPGVEVFVDPPICSETL